MIQTLCGAGPRLVSARPTEATAATARSSPGAAGAATFSSIESRKSALAALQGLSGGGELPYPSYLSPAATPRANRSRGEAAGLSRQSPSGGEGRGQSSTHAISRCSNAARSPASDSQLAAQIRRSCVSVHAVYLSR
jgi:hypothetical protein